MQTSFLSKISDDKDSSRELVPRVISEEPELDIRVFNYWKGTSQFFLKGRLMLGPKEEMFFAYMFLGLLAILTFSFYSIILPSLQNRYKVPLGCGFLFGLGFFLTFYFLTATTDPGYLPHDNILNYPPALNLETENDRCLYKTISGSKRAIENVSKEENGGNKVDEPNFVEELRMSDNKAKKIHENHEEAKKSDEVKYESAQDEDDKMAEQARINLQLELQQLPIATTALENKNANENKPSQSEIPTDTITIRVENFREARRFCLYCKIYKLENTYHCVKCNCCVRVFNHHCMLVNNCIGKRNYKYFILLVFFGFLLNLYFVTCLVLYHEKAGSSANYLYKFLFFLSIFQGIMIFCFCIYYLVNFLLFQGRRPITRPEDSKLNDEAEHNDMCSISPSLIDFSRGVDVEDAHLLETD
jgi:hypothetical protein